MRKILVIGTILATMLMVGCGNQEAAEHEQSVWNEMESASVVPDQDGNKFYTEDDDKAYVTVDGKSVDIIRRTSNDKEDERKFVVDKKEIKKLSDEFSGEYVSDDKSAEEVFAEIDSNTEYIVYFRDTTNVAKDPKYTASFAVMGDYAYFVSDTRYKPYFKKINSGLIKSLF